MPLCLSRPRFLLLLFLFILSLLVMVWGEEEEVPPRRPLLLDQQVEGCEEEEKKKKTEWRLLHPTETVPQGSHVRLDMTTGERFMKEEKAEGTVGSRLLATLEPLGEVDVELKERITLIKASGVPGSEAFEAGVKKLWDERQTMLKGTSPSSQQHNDTTMEVNPEHVALPFLIEAVKMHPSLPIRIKALIEIEFRVQSIDEAEVFTKMGGMEVCVAALTDTSMEIRSHAAHVLGSAIKSAHHLQEELLSHNGFTTLLELLRHNETETKAMYALGALLRGNSKACAQAEQHPEFASLLISRLRSPSPVSDKAGALIGDLLQQGMMRDVFFKARLCAHVQWMGTQETKSRHYDYLRQATLDECDEE